jgi:hypothetical protein
LGLTTALSSRSAALAQLYVVGAAFFAGIRGELDPIDGKHVFFDQSLRIAGHQYLGEQGFDLSAQWN